MPLKLKVNRNFLHLATARAQGAINDRGMAQIGLKVGGGKLSVSAADSILAVYTSCECESLAEGFVFVPAKIFSEIVRELPDGMIKLESAASQLVITAGSRDEFMMKIPLIENAVWREAPSFDTDNSADLPAAKLTYMVEQVQFCVSQESSRNYGTVGFLHRPNKETIRLVGTDGFRLSYCEVGTAMPDGFLDNGVALSKRALNEILRMCSEGFETVHIAISADQTALLAKVPDYQIFVRLSAVKYPNYAGVIPEAKQSRVMVSRTQLQNVARRVLLAADKSHALQLSFSDSSLTLASKTMGSSEGKESVFLDDYHGPRCDLAVNGKFLADVFATTPSEKLTLQFKDVEEPMVIVPRDEPSDCRSKHVLVPIRESE
jgi:DNA polymerase-3 subunit beta